MNFTFSSYADQDQEGVQKINHDKDHYQSQNFTIFIAAATLLLGPLQASLEFAWKRIKSWPRAHSNQQPHIAIYSHAWSFFCDWTQVRNCQHGFDSYIKMQVFVSLLIGPQTAQFAQIHQKLVGKISCWQVSFVSAKLFWPDDKTSCSRLLRFLCGSKFKKMT